MDTKGNILIYQNEKGDTKVDAYFNDDTIWMSRKSICELYQLSKSSISEHISNIYIYRWRIVYRINCSEIPNSSTGRYSSKFLIVIVIL